MAGVVESMGGEITKLCNFVLKMGVYPPQLFASPQAKWLSSSTKWEGNPVHTLPCCGFIGCSKLRGGGGIKFGLHNFL